MKVLRAIFAATIFFVFGAINFQAEAKNFPVIGIVDFTSRVPITNLDNEQVEVFHAAPMIIMDEIISCADLRDLTGETTKAIMDELLIMMQVGKITPEVRDVASVEGCEYLLVGYLTNLSRTTDEKIIGKGDGIRAGLSVRIFDVATGEEVAIFTGKGIAKARVNRIGRIFRSGQLEFSEDCLNQALEKAAHEIAEKIKKNI